jgi:hypothetical protein
MLTSLSAQKHSLLFVNIKTSTARLLFFHIIQNLLPAQGLKEQNFYKMCGCSLISPDRAQSQFYLIGT